MAQRLPRFVTSLVLLTALQVIPTTSAVACSCGGPGPAERLAHTDVVFIGSVTEEREPDPGVPFAEAVYVFDVERSRQPIGSPYGVAAWFGDGAGCGFDMGIGERWLIFATLEDGVPRTNLCHGTTPFPPADELMRRLVEAQLTELPDPAADPGAVDGQPGPIPGVGPVAEAPPVNEEPGAVARPSALVAVFGAFLLLAVSLVAFRRIR